MTSQTGSPSVDKSWKMFAVIAVTWTIILVCITLSMYQSEECTARWSHVRSGLTGAVADLETLKQQNKELRSTLMELSRLQMLDLRIRLKNSEKVDLFETLIKKMSQREPELSDARR